MEWIRRLQYNNGLGKIASQTAWKQGLRVQINDFPLLEVSQVDAYADAIDDRLTIRDVNGERVFEYEYVGGNVVAGPGKYKITLRELRVGKIGGARPKNKPAAEAKTPPQSVETLDELVDEVSQPNFAKNKFTVKKCPCGGAKYEVPVELQHEIDPEDNIGDDDE